MRNVKKPPYSKQWLGLIVFFHFDSIPLIAINIKYLTPKNYCPSQIKKKKKEEMLKGMVIAYIIHHTWGLGTNAHYKFYALH